MKSKQFMNEVGQRVGLASGTCRAYLNLCGFKAAKTIAGRQFIENEWDASQIPQAVEAIENFRKARRES